jgi:hypothetical protein
MGVVFNDKDNNNPQHEYHNCDHQYKAVHHHYVLKLAYNSRSKLKIYILFKASLPTNALFIKT